MGCILSLLWLPLLALGGYVGFTVGVAAGGDAGALIGGFAGVLVSHLIQWALWGDRRRASVPPPWWNN